MSRIQPIASLLNTTEDRARAFCVSVQRSCEQAPSYKVILQTLRCLSPEERTVYNVVQYIQKNTIGLPISSVVSRQRPAIRSIPTKTHGGFDNWDDDNFPSPVMAHDPRDHIANFEKCPHGIPKFRICAICDPKRFRDFMDPD
jgi:hypothetical protein